MADSEGCKKSLEGGQRLQQGASLGPFCLNTVEAGDRSTGSWSKATESSVSLCQLVSTVETFPVG